jgi:hypothetical protein
VGVPTERVVASAEGPARAAKDVAAPRADALGHRVGFVSARQDGAEGPTAPGAGQGEADEALETIRRNIPRTVAVTIERLDGGHDINLSPAVGDGKRKSRRNAAWVRDSKGDKKFGPSFFFVRSFSTEIARFFDSLSTGSATRSRGRQALAGTCESRSSPTKASAGTIGRSAPGSQHTRR